MAEILVQYGRSSRSSWSKSLRSSFGRTVVGTTVRENSIGARLGERFPIGNACSYTVKKGYSYLVCMDDRKLAGKKQNIDPIWKVFNKQVDLGEPTSFFDHVSWDACKHKAKKAKILWTDTEPCSNPEFPHEQRKNYQARKTHFYVFLWYGPDTLWSVNQLARAITKMDQSMWQTSTTLDLLHSFHKWIQTALTCGKHSTTMQIGTVSRLWLCWRSWRFEIDFRWNVVYFWQSLACSKKLDV